MPNSTVELLRQHPPEGTRLSEHHDAETPWKPMEAARWSRGVIGVATIHDVASGILTREEWTTHIGDLAPDHSTCSEH